MSSLSPATLPTVPVPLLDTLMFGVLTPNSMATLDSSGVGFTGSTATVSSLVQLAMNVMAIAA